MGPWAFGVPLILVSTLGLLLNGYVLLVVLGLGKQVNRNEQIYVYTHGIRKHNFVYYVYNRSYIIPMLFVVGSKRGFQRDARAESS